MLFLNFRNFPSQINPKKVVKKGWVQLVEESVIGPVGIDFSISEDLILLPYGQKIAYLAFGTLNTLCCQDTYGGVVPENGDKTLFLYQKEGVEILDCAKNILFQETVRIPANVFMRFKLRSSWVRKGVLVSSAIFEPFYGSDSEMLKTSEGKGATAGCTIVNFGDKPIYFPKGTRIAQTVFEWADPSKKYDGHYSKKFKDIKSQY